MKAERQLAPATFLYTDLVNSTELLQRAGDERAQQILAAAGYTIVRVGSQWAGHHHNAVEGPYVR